MGSVPLLGSVQHCWAGSVALGEAQAGSGTPGRVAPRGEMRPSGRRPLPKLPCELGWRRALGTKRAAALGMSSREQHQSCECSTAAPSHTFPPACPLEIRVELEAGAGGGSQVWQCPSPTKVRLTAPQEMLTGALMGMTRNRMPLNFHQACLNHLDSGFLPAVPK
ncbi:unnamed protein product [Coccothraustes coccothraustes]